MASEMKEYESDMKEHFVRNRIQNVLDVMILKCANLFLYLQETKQIGVAQTIEFCIAPSHLKQW